MTKMHENEFEIDEHLVRSLLNSQCPQWAHLPIKAVLSSGTDNALFRLGDEYVIRLPRLDGAFANITKEYDSTL
jgi:aminoglycoside phosphotransferase (APT) family kinase protein